MAKLSPDSLASCFTLEQIEEKIVIFTEALEGATVRMYDKDTGQGRQKVESEEIKNIQEILQAYLKAKQILSGTNRITTATIDYNPARSGGNM